MKEKIKLLEEFSGLMMHNKIMILLVLLGEKPATEIILRVCAEYPYKNTVKPKKLYLPEIRELLGRMGLSYSVRIIYSSGHVFLYIAKDQETVNGTSQSVFAPHRDDEKFGRYMGFPETAIEAFLKKRPRLDEGRQSKITKSKLLFFSGFVFSEEFYLKELKEVSIRWYLAVKKHSPELFRENAALCKYYFGK